MEGVLTCVLIGSALAVLWMAAYIIIDQMLKCRHKS